MLVSQFPLTRIGQLHPRAGTRRFPKDSDLMLNFDLEDSNGRTIRNTNHEAHEQFIVKSFLSPRDIVFEFGGGLGANSIQINAHLHKAVKSKHVVFEPQPELVAVMRRNRNAQKSQFQIVEGALTKCTSLCMRPFQSDRRTSNPDSWIYSRTEPAGDKKGMRHINSITELPSQRPTAIVADCEGCLLDVLTDFPSLLDTVTFVYFENDGGRTVCKGIIERLTRVGLVPVLKTQQHRVFLSAARRDAFLLHRCG